MSNITLTANEVAVLSMIKEGNAQFFDMGWTAFSESWLDCLTDDIHSLLNISNKAAGGVISSLIKKGMFIPTNESVLISEEALTSI